MVSLLPSSTSDATATDVIRLTALVLTSGNTDCALPYQTHYATGICLESLCIGISQF